MRINTKLNIVLLRTTEWKLIFKPFGYHKLLLAFFGFLLTGHIGGIFLGLFFGLIMDCELLVKHKPKKPSDNRISYLMLGAFVLQASELGNRIMNETLRYRLVEKFGEDYATKRFAFFNELMRQRIQVEAICDQIKSYATENEKKDIIQFLFDLSFHPTANSDKLHHSINYIAARISLSYEAVQEIYNAFKNQHTRRQYKTTTTSNHKPSDIYSTFNLTSNCTEKELKTAFHHLAKKYHPDSNPSASGSEKIIMQDKLRKIIEAYDEIKLRRGWK